MLRPVLRALAATAAVALLAVPASGQLVSYTFTGTVAGSYGSTTFSNILATFTTSNDFDAHPVDPTAPSHITRVSGLTFTVDLPGIVTGTFTNPLKLFVNRNTQTVGFGSPTLDYFNISNPFAGIENYYLDTSFGLVTDPVVSGIHQFVNVPVEGKLLTLTSARAGTFQAIGPATTAPEPASVALVATGLVALVVVARRRRPSHA